jgi:hypothetical protein
MTITRSFSGLCFLWGYTTAKMKGHNLFDSDPDFDQRELEVGSMPEDRQKPEDG